MENKSDSKSAPSKSPMGWIIGGVVAVIIAIGLYVMSKNSADAALEKEKADKAAKEKADKEAADKAAKEKAAAERARIEADAEKARIEEVYRNPPRYERPSGALNLEWQVPSNIELKNYVGSMREIGWQDDMISYGAAWLKGMSLPINSTWAIKSYKSIKDFKSKVPNLPRNPSFMLEVQNYPFMPGDLIDDGHTAFSSLKF